MPGTLVVTDDALIIREMIKDAAVEAGWEIVGEASNGKQAADVYDRVQPDAMTLDLVMPDYDGLYALRHVLESDPQANVLVVSALDQQSVVKEAFRLGAADFIVKPFEKTALVEALAKLC